MGLFGFLFGNKANKLKTFQEKGAIILDVRSKAEYDSGAIPGSKHIPLQQIQAKAKEIKQWNKPVITCCASGMRSGSAAAILRSHGVEAMNGGGWQSLYNKL
ncbi:rhodanese-like domain-containing protein [Olleya aquimaris]|uniref:Rhodanese-related sulfurtransferase n=1 Tax=Olleya aquimaris TaxID=639310 RepID=A0A327RG39_9FLAO|nr:rhodanese-like domain-containing protein [Olleya aquimaris]RAJ15208.1 rhodanese-related sulfurtransferase [Olleya aquimaris]